MPRLSHVVLTAAALLIAVTSTIVSASSSSGDASQQLPVVRVGVIYDGDWGLMQSLTAGIRQELDILAEGEFEIRYPSEHHRSGDWDLARIDALFREMLADDEVDLIIAAGLAISQIACNEREGYDKPVIAPLSLDYQIQDLPRTGEGSGIRNLTYVAMQSTLRGELEYFHEIVRFRHIALIANREVLESRPSIGPRTLEQLDGLPFRATYAMAGRTAASVIEALPEEIDAVYIWPLLLDSGEMDLLLQEFKRLRLPSFSWLGREQVVAGALATMSSDAGRSRLARRVALDIQQVLLGTPPEQVAVDFSNTSRLIINAETARAIEAPLRYEILLEAELVGNRRGPSLSQLSLSDAVRRAVETNLALDASRVSVEAGLQDVALARAARRPTLDATLDAARIDEDRAAASFGQAPERVLTGRLNGQQLIYSDDVTGRVQIASEQQRSREWDLEQQQLDVALEAAVAYLNLLRAETQIEVRRTNLELTRSNLELAYTRNRIGTAGQAEIFRWRSQIANDRRDLLDADAATRTARVALNRLMNEALEAEYRATDISLEDPDYSPGSGLLDGYIETPRHFRVLREFVVERGLTRSPELQAIEASIAAQRRALTSSKRAYWLPTFSAQASLDERLSQSGAGSTPPPGGADDRNWSVGVGATLPLFAGGARAADRRRNQLLIRQLELQRDAIVQSVESSIRVAMIDARAAYSGIGLARAAADAAGENFELVQDSYARGAVSIIDLLDAQSSALAAGLRANDAVYDFFIELMRVQRASNRFDFFSSAEDRRKWADEIEQHFAEQGVVPWEE